MMMEVWSLKNHKLKKKKDQLWNLENNSLQILLVNLVKIKNHQQKEAKRDHKNLHGLRQKNNKKKKKKQKLMNSLTSRMILTMNSTWKITKSDRRWPSSNKESTKSRKTATGNKTLQMNGTKLPNRNKKQQPLRGRKLRMRKVCFHTVSQFSSFFNLF